MELSERIAVIVECQQLALAFARHVDFREIDRLLEIFTEDAVLLVRGEEHRGHAAIRATMERRSPVLTTRHQCMAPMIDVIDGSSASGVTYFANYRHEGEREGKGLLPLTGPEIVGEFLDTFVKTPSGWKIARRQARGVFRKS